MAWSMPQFLEIHLIKKILLVQLYGCTGSIFNINIAQHYDQKQVSDGFWKHFIIVVYKPPKKQKSAGTVLKTEEDAERPSFPADKSIAQSDMKRKRFMGRCFRKNAAFRREIRSSPGKAAFSC